MLKIGDVPGSNANEMGEFGEDAVRIMAAWLNAVQRELTSILLSRGIALNPADDTQLATLFNGHFDAANPHGTTAADVGADAAGTAANELASHLVAAHPHSQYVMAALIGAASGVCPLDASGMVPSDYLPAIAISDVFPVASEAEQIALVAQRGDVAVRSDLAGVPGATPNWIHNGGDTGTMADWAPLLTPTDAVLTVFGRTGAVSAADGDYAASQITVLEQNGVTGTRVQAALEVLATAAALRLRVDAAQPLNAAQQAQAQANLGLDAYVTLADAATIAWDMSAGRNFSVTLTDARELGFPTNTVPGKSGWLVVDCAGFALTFETGGAHEFVFDSGTPPAVSGVTVFRYIVLPAGDVALAPMSAVA